MIAGTPYSDKDLREIIIPSYIESLGDDHTDYNALLFIFMQDIKPHHNPKFIKYWKLIESRILLLLFLCPPSLMIKYKDYHIYDIPMPKEDYLKIIRRYDLLIAALILLLEYWLEELNSSKQNNVHYTQSSDIKFLLEFGFLIVPG